MAKNLSKKIRKNLQGRVRVISTNPIGNLTNRFLAAKSVVRVLFCFYFLLFLNDLTFIVSVFGRDAALSPPPIGFWLQVIGIDWSSVVIYTLYFISAITCIIWSHLRWARITLFLSFLSSNTLKFSLGTVAHDTNGWIWLAFALIFLPSKDEKISERTYKYHYLSICWFATAISLSIYTMSGIWKILMGLLYDGLVNGHTFFSSNAMSYHLARYIFRNGYNLPSAEIVISNSWLGWPMLTGAVYMQFFAFWVPFRPLIFLPWLLMLASFHSLNIVLMNLPFNKQGFLAVLVLGGMPFLVKAKNLNQMIITLPLFGWLYKTFVTQIFKVQTIEVIRYDIERF